MYENDLIMEQFSSGDAARKIRDLVHLLAHDEMTVKESELLTEHIHTLLFDKYEAVEKRQMEKYSSTEVGE